MERRRVSCVSWHFEFTPHAETFFLVDPGPMCSLCAPTPRTPPDSQPPPEHATSVIVHGSPLLRLRTWVSVVRVLPGALVFVVRSWTCEAGSAWRTRAAPPIPRDRRVRTKLGAAHPTSTVTMATRRRGASLHAQPPDLPQTNERPRRHPEAERDRGHHVGVQLGLAGLDALDE